LSLRITESSYKHFHQGNTYQSSSFQIKLYFLLEQRCAKVPPWMMSSFESNKTSSILPDPSDGVLIGSGTSRIVGGDDAPFPIPWQVHVHVDGIPVCGGTILDETTILSAAQCFLADYQSSFIVAGITMEGSIDGQRREVKEVVNHPKYNSMTWDNDVAILKLDLPLTFNENVQPACLPDPSFTPEDSGEFAVVSGWGYTSEGT
jgi:hypothetical protein